MSIVQDLSYTTLQTLIKDLGMEELGSVKQPFKTLRSPLEVEPVGCARVFKSKSAMQLVYINLTVAKIQMDSHMLFCFSGADSLLPHFTLDAVYAGGSHAFHLDLIPKVDLSINFNYLQTVYQPLTSVFSEAKKIQGLSEAHISPLQRAVMSPWMLAHRANAEAMDSMGIVCSQYLTHWLKLTNTDWASLECYPQQDLAIRDARHRSILFNRTVDPVWQQVDRLLGEESSEDLRRLLQGA